MAKPDLKSRAAKPGPGKWRRRLFGHAEDAVHFVSTSVREPRRGASMMRDGLLRVWQARGGGLYGLGYVVTFAILEVRLFVDDIAGSAGVLDFVEQEIFGLLFRLTVDTLLNSLLAFLWPLLLIDLLGPIAVAMLAVGFLVFERWVKPSVLRALQAIPGEHQDER